MAQVRQWSMQPSTTSATLEFGSTLWMLQQPIVQLCSVAIGSAEVRDAVDSLLENVLLL